MIRLADATKQNLYRGFAVVALMSCVFAFNVAAAGAQNGNLQNMLDRVDSSTSLPTSSAPPANYGGQRQPMNGYAMQPQYGSQPSYMSQYGQPANGQMAMPPQQRMAQPMQNLGAAMPANAMGAMSQGAGMNPMGGLFGAPGGMQNPMNRMNLLKMFMGGSPSSGPGQSNAAKANRDQSASSNAQENLQTAVDQASQAEGAAQRASSGNDKGARMSAAEEARYAAGTFVKTTTQTHSAAYGTGGGANDYAAQARDAADRAQSAADRATANAENYQEHKGGW